MQGGGGGAGGTAIEIIDVSSVASVSVTIGAGGTGSKGKAVVGTVSGTSISFGSSVNFDESSASLMSNSFDTSSNKVVICFKDTANSNVGTAVFGTVSGTSISFAASSAFVGGGITST